MPNTTISLGNGSALDIASCDGPVRFHRILNPILMETDDESTTNEDTDPTVDVVSDVTDNESQTGGGCGSSNNQFIPSKNDANSGATYKCVFCNHIFKSHYCYQKHKRRHLNPFTVDFTIAAEKKLTSFSTPPPQQTSASTDLQSSSTAMANNLATATNSNIISHPTKDINVQFFPCKICGAKFPSYYFVHKHKKIWHPESVNSPPTLPSTSTICNENVKN